MTKIGLLSDTHGWLNPAVFEFFKDCDEIWHAGDIGSAYGMQATSARPMSPMLCRPSSH